MQWCRGRTNFLYLLLQVRVINYCKLTCYSPISSNDHFFRHWTKQKEVQIFITKIMKKFQVANKRKYIPSLQKMFEFEQNKKKTSISSTSETMQIQTWWCCQFGRENKSKIVIPKKVQLYKSMSRREVVQNIRRYKSTVLLCKLKKWRPIFENMLSTNT